MNALDWIRDKAEVSGVETMTILPEQAGQGTKSGLWQVTRLHFKGRLPTKMVYSVKAELGKLVKLYDGDKQINETLRVGGQYRSEFNNCEYSKTVYEFISEDGLTA